MRESSTYVESESVESVGDVAVDNELFGEAFKSGGDEGVVFQAAAVAICKAVCISPRSRSNTSIARRTRCISTYKGSSRVAEFDRWEEESRASPGA